MIRKLENFNHFSCTYYRKKKDGSLEKNNNNACWAGMRQWLGKKPEEIYIKNFEREETLQYVPVLVREINKITPCSVEEINGTKYIKFQLLPKYDQSLVLLNFIRNLWHNPKDFNWKNKNIDTVYYYVFFETLKKSRFKDGLKRLTSANKKACKDSGGRFVGHSNMFPHNELNIKSKEELLKYNGTSIHHFFSS